MIGVQCAPPFPIDEFAKLERAQRVQNAWKVSQVFRSHLIPDIKCFQPYFHFLTPLKLSAITSSNLTALCNTTAQFHQAEAIQGGGILAWLPKGAGLILALFSLRAVFPEDEKSNQVLFCICWLIFSHFFSFYLFLFFSWRTRLNLSQRSVVPGSATLWALPQNTSSKQGLRCWARK